MNKAVLLHLSIVLAAVIIAPGSSSCQDSQQASAVSSNFTVQKLYEDFSNPWGMVWLPDGRMLVTERAGEILVFKNDKFTGEKLSGVPEVYNNGQGGLLDIKLHPDYQKNHWIYISYAKPVEG